MQQFNFGPAVHVAANPDRVKRPHNVGRKSDGVGYAMWHQAYDQCLLTHLGMQSDDLPDIYSEADAYEVSDLTPFEAAKACINLHISDDEDDDLSGSWY